MNSKEEFSAATDPIYQDEPLYYALLYIANNTHMPEK